MLFLLCFVILTLALPLSVEIYKKGSDNVVTRSGKELAQTKPGSMIIYGPGKALATLSDFAKGSIIMGSFGLLLVIGWKIISALLKLLL